MAVANGDPLRRRSTVDVKGEILQLKDTINTAGGPAPPRFASEVTRQWPARSAPRASWAVEADVKRVAGTCRKDFTDSVNFMAGNLTARVQHRRGDDGRRQRRPVEEDHRRRQGRDSRAQEHHQYDGGPAAAHFAAEVTPRGPRQVGTEGKLGGQADVQGTSPGPGRTFTDSGQLRWPATSPPGCRNIADVTTGRPAGDLSKKITVDVKGEILELKNTINTMVDQLRSLRRRGDAVALRGRHRGHPRRAGRRPRRRRSTWKDPDRQR